MNIIKNIVLIAGSCWFITGYAQNRISATSNNGWYMYFGNHRLTEKWGLHTEYQWRRAEIITNWQQSLTRIGIDYHLNKQAILTAGYGFITTWPYGDQPVAYMFNEHRLWQQLLLSQTINRFYFQHRYRIEERWLENKALNNINQFALTDIIYRNRLRYRFMTTIPIGKKELTDKTFFLCFYNELFISFGKNTGKNIFDQNRVYFAAGFRFHSNMNMQIGYMYHTMLKSDAIHIENNNTLQVAVTYNLDFRKQGT